MEPITTTFKGSHIILGSSSVARRKIGAEMGYEFTVMVVVYEGIIREKPSGKEEAWQFIEGYSGEQAATVSSVFVLNLKTGFRKGEWDRVEIYFHELPDEVSDKPIEEGTVLYVAGGLIIEHPLIGPYVKQTVGTTDGV